MLALHALTHVHVYMVHAHYVKLGMDGSKELAMLEDAVAVRVHDARDVCNIRKIKERLTLRWRSTTAFGFSARVHTSPHTSTT